MTAEPTRFTFPANPDPVETDLSEVAVLVIDMQNEFGSPGGMFDRAGIDISGIRATVGPTGRVLDAARAIDIPVIYLTMQHRKDMADIGPGGSPHREKHGFFGVGSHNISPDGQENRVLIEGFWGTEILAELAPHPGDIVVPKHRYSGFFETSLDGILRSRGIRQLIVTGCTTSVCVESTVRDAMFRDYHCCVLSDCTAEPIGASNSRGNHEASLLTIQLLLGRVAESVDFVSAVSRHKRPALESPPF